MTAVSPVPLEAVSDVEDGKTSEPESPVVQNSGEKLEGIVIIDDEIALKRKMTIEDGLRPLLAGMKLIGLYFSRPANDAGEDVGKKSRKWTVNMIYGATVVTLLWINAVRMLSVFTREDKFGMVLLNKIVTVTWMTQCAVSQSAFYAASFSGRLAVVFRQTLNDSSARNMRKFSTFLAVVAWSFILMTKACFAYVVFCTDFLVDTMIAPFQSHIILSNPLIPRLIIQLILFYLLSVYVLSQAMTFVLAMIFSHEFKKVNNELGRCLDNQERRVSDVDIETFRQKHQEISMTVSYLDDSLMFSNASAFCCQLCCLIMLLYVLIFYHSLMDDPVTITVHVFWMTQMFFGLTLTAAGGIIVNHYVSIMPLNYQQCQAIVHSATLIIFFLFHFYTLLYQLFKIQNQRNHFYLECEFRITLELLYPG